MILEGAVWIEPCCSRPGGAATAGSGGEQALSAWQVRDMMCREQTFNF
jgi:hypothetical protein